ncbi:dehydrase and lipid transport-domain-containing protein [Lentinula raphanica]|uniref:Dehydrase and lipid transport-domain-containing protein n=1 Tax=Lentinula raphanica TaxID=153919 RepID=A0AA38PEI9_9AGAR|nr:dehydrase and lipid transport-domain-containing protein [Lentinula raphanica]KAJ3841460.1 dehydrase and lipid transport-domain-containing protein [Lentinula raphanica]KAJ3975515.1 dehydrase and lipid transport-domain-containing protein [Lentinula raphanica]
MMLFSRVPPLANRCKRSFFSLPSFDSTPQTFRESKVFPYKKEELFDIVSNVTSYPQFVPFCTGSRILNSSPREEMRPYMMDAELTVGFLSFNESYISRVTCVPYSSVKAVASSSTPLFKTLSTVWQFEPRPEGKDGEHTTLVTLDLSFAFASPVHAAVSSAFFGQVSKQMVQAFENRCSSVYDSKNRHHTSFLP